MIATGIAAFAARPGSFAGIPPEFASHASDHADLSVFAGRRIAVIGGGQSALESAALLHEAGAQVEVLVRAAEVRWLRYGTDSRLHAALHSERNPLKNLLFPPSDIGPPGINLLVDKPALFTKIPTRELQDRIAYRAIRPAGSGWLRARLASVPITTSVAPVAATVTGPTLRIDLSDRSVRTVDHALLATGYAPDVARIPFLAPSLLRRIRRIGTYPRLSSGSESSVRGLHFVGATAAMRFGPLMRFVAGTGLRGPLGDAGGRGRSDGCGREQPWGSRVVTSHDPPDPSPHRSRRAIPGSDSSIWPSRSPPPSCSRR